MLALRRVVGQSTPYLLILPALLTLLSLFIYPIGWNVYLSLHDVEFRTFLRGDWDFVVLRNYGALLADLEFPRKFHESLWVSLKFVGGSIAGQFLLGLALAGALYGRIRGRELYRLIIVIPWILSELVVGYIWLFLYQPYGAINQFLRGIGLSGVNWLGDRHMAVWSLVMTNIWFGVPFTMLMLGAALTTIHPELKEAASVDGAGRLQVFRHITWPLIAPFAALNLILITMWTTNLFALPLAMTKGGPLFATTTTSLLMYRHAFEFGNLSLGSSIGVMLFLFNIVAAGVYLRTLRQT